MKRENVDIVKKSLKTRHYQPSVVRLSAIFTLSRTAYRRPFGCSETKPDETSSKPNVASQQTGPQSCALPERLIHKCACEKLQSRIHQSVTNQLH